MYRLKPITAAVILSCFSATTWAQQGPDNLRPPRQEDPRQENQRQGNQILRGADADTPTPGVSPVRRINRQPQQFANEPALNDRFRTIDGSDNNLGDPDIGKAHTQLLRLARSAYGNGISTLAGQIRPSARRISNLIVAQPELVPIANGSSDFLWQWGQFLDHDIDLTDGVDPAEPVTIEVPAGDVFFDPTGTGTATIEMNRSLYDIDTGLALGNPRQQINEITAWIDASNVYGSDSDRALALRTNDDTGQLRTSDGNLLPFNDVGLANAGGDSDALFLAGDVRANEQVGLTAMHTLFMREHNWQASRIAVSQPGLNGDQIYERARQIVGAEMQAITYLEYLPALLGDNAISGYTGYESNLDSGIANIFSSAAFRYGHSALSPTLLRLDANLDTIPEGDLPLRDAFFSPQRLVTEGGIEPMLRGFANQVCQKVDNYVIDDVRNFLFGEPGSGGFDLASLNIQRGRDHGLPSYNNSRAAFGLDRVTDFADISSDTSVQAALEEAYGNVNRIDVWVGGLAEDHIEGAEVGELISQVLKEQFEALRDGDRYWYELSLNQGDLDRVRNTTLADIIRRNTSIGNELSDNVFQVTIQ